MVKIGQGHKDFTLPDGNELRIRVLHPERPEHISGADMIYERHNVRCKTAQIVAVQYKIWDDRWMYLSDERMTRQLAKMETFSCKGGLCSAGLGAYPITAAVLQAMRAN